LISLADESLFFYIFNQMIPLKLYYKTGYIADLSNSNIEFPRSDSVYKLAENVDSLMLDFINYSIEYSKLVNMENDKALELFLEKEEPKYLELIESSEWSIVDSEGLIHPILAPIFHLDNSIVWMLNL
jgi:hypothetical protein